MKYYFNFILALFVLFKVTSSENCSGHFNNAAELQPVKDMCINLTRERNVAAGLPEEGGRYSIVELSTHEYGDQIEFTNDTKVDKILALCCDADTNGKRTYDFRNDSCVANQVFRTIQGVDPDKLEKLRLERRVQLCEAIVKVASFILRLEDVTESVVQLGLFLIALALGAYLTVVGHFQLQTLFDPLHPDPTKGWPFWVYKSMKYYVVPVGKETEHMKINNEQKAAITQARGGHQIEIDEVLDSDDEKEDVLQTAAAVTDYSDFWNLFQDQTGADKKQQGKKSVTNIIKSENVKP